ncbi:MAG: hypothetical protein ACNA7G_10035 [Methylobacter sp.]
MMHLKKHPIAALLVTTLLLLPTIGAHAQDFHQDVEVTVVDSRLQTGFCSRPDSGCSIIGTEQLGLPSGTLPIDHQTGKPIYVTPFFTVLGTTASENPGFQAFPGSLAGGDIIKYQAIGQLHYWDPTINQWTLAPSHLQIRLAGGLDLQPNQNCGLVFCLPTAVEGYTVYTAEGVAGAASLIVGEAKPDGSLHTHLDWFLESTTQVPGGPAGAYRVEMRLFSEQHPDPSDAFLILFNNGLSNEQFQLALSSHVQANLAAPLDKPRIDALFNWAEAFYADLFPHHADSADILGYYARCYDNGLCIGAKDGHVFATGGSFGPAIVDVGSLDLFFGLAGL